MGRKVAGSRKIKVSFALILLLCACSSINPATNSPLEAIDQIRVLAGFPASTLSFVETTNMTNSPTGQLPVDLYQDETGRNFFVDPTSNTVVEIDARDSLLYDVNRSPGPELTKEELEKKAEEFVRSAVPGFASIEDSLSYEAGQKGDNFFFTWRVLGNPENLFMSPFIQLGLTSSGDLFAFYNTVTIH